MLGWRRTPSNGSVVGWPRVDIAVGLGLAATSLLLLAQGTGRLNVPWWAWLLVVAHALPLAARRRAPRASFVVSAAAAGIYLLAGAPTVGLGPTPLVLLWSVAAETAPAFSVAGWGGVVAGAAVAAQVSGNRDRLDTLVTDALMLGVAWAVGNASRRRRIHVEAERIDAAQRAAADERLRIARELHDVVAHGMSVIAVQAGSGRLLAGDDPDGPGRALAIIERTSRETLDELRRVVGVLREETTGVAPPLPGLADLDRVVADIEAAGTPVDLALEGDHRDLPPGHALAVVRIVQESLTNVHRHAPCATAAVRVRFDPAKVAVTVTNATDGATPAGPGGGHGLVGMRERVALYGGSFESGPAPDGTWAVRAVLPHREDLA